MEKKMIDAMSKLPSKPLRSITILVVDDDPTCLSIVAALLKSWKYEVVTVKHAIDALCALRLKNDYFDLVVTDIHMPDMDGFELHRIIKEEFNLPVVFMSADDKDSVIFEGLANGAAYFIVKPVTPADLKNLWQYAVAKKAGKGNLVDQELVTPTSHQITDDASKDTRQILLQPEKEVLNIGSSSTATATANERTKRRCPSKLVAEDSIAPKKVKVVWTNGLHNQFLQAVRTLGLNRAVPKKILELMNVPGLTRENIASHLQKYRIFLKRVSEAGCRIQSSAERRLSQTSLESMFNYHGQPLLSEKTGGKSPALDSPDPIQSSSSDATYSISRHVLGQSPLPSNYGKSQPLRLTGANNNLYQSDTLSAPLRMDNRKGKNRAIEASPSTTTTTTTTLVKASGNLGNPNPSEKMPANFAANGYSDYNLSVNNTSNNIMPVSSYAGLRLGSDGCLVGIRNSGNYASKAVSSNNVNGGGSLRMMSRPDNSGFILGQVGSSTLLRNRDQSPQIRNTATLVGPGPNMAPPSPNRNIMRNNNHRAGNDGRDFGLIHNTIYNHDPNSIFLNQATNPLQVQTPNYMPRQGFKPTNNNPISAYEFGQTSQQPRVEEETWDHLEDCFPSSVLEENTASHPILLEDEEFLRSVLGYGDCDGDDDNDNDNFGSY